MRYACLAVAILLVGSAAAAPAHAQRPAIGVAPHVGTMGIGADVALSLHPRITVRAGGNFFPIDFDITASDVSYSFDLPSPQLMLVADVMLLGPFRLTGGVRFLGNDLEATATLAPTETVDIGASTYTGAEVGSLIGVIGANKLAPYVGIGIGNVARRGFGFFLDLGVAFQGAPEVTLDATGPIADVVSFQTDLDQEIASFEDDIDLYQYYPVVSLGFSIGF